MESRGQGKGHGLDSSRGKEKREVAERRSGRQATQKDLELQGQPVRDEDCGRRRGKKGGLAVGGSSGCCSLACCGWGRAFGQAPHY